MEYLIYKLEFTTGVHFGTGTLSKSRISFPADTLFSALFSEAVQMGNNCMEKLYSLVSEKKLLFSDSLPYIGDRFYIPKPFCHIEQKAADIDTGKVFKKILYIEDKDTESFMAGEYNTGSALDLGSFGRHEVRDMVSVRGEEEPLPYRINIYHYSKGCGLYIILAYDRRESREFFEELLSAVSLIGIGGKRASGLGRFSFRSVKLPDGWAVRLNSEYKDYMLLSGGLPMDDELETVLKGASYKLSLRSGFVQSEFYAEGQLRKRDAYMLDCGSVVGIRFNGRILDVGANGKHPVYRYAMPMFWGLRK